MSKSKKSHSIPNTSLDLGVFFRWVQEHTILNILRSTRHNTCLSIDWRGEWMGSCRLIYDCGFKLIWWSLFWLWGLLIKRTIMLFYLNAKNHSGALNCRDRCHKSFMEESLLGEAREIDLFKEVIDKYIILDTRR